MLTRVRNDGSPMRSSLVTRVRNRELDLCSMALLAPERCHEVPVESFLHPALRDLVLAVRAEHDELGAIDLLHVFGRMAATARAKIPRLLGMDLVENDDAAIVELILRLKDRQTSAAHLRPTIERHAHAVRMLRAFEIAEKAREAAANGADLRDLAQAFDSVARGAASSNGTTVVRLSDVEPVELEWLWPGVIPLGKLTVFCGDPGVNKSFLTLDIASRVSRGASWPPACPMQEGTPGSAVILSGEDALDDTIRPRLDAAGADVDRVHAIVDVRSDSFVLDKHLPDLEGVIERLGDVRVVVIDPISSFLGKINSWNESEVRGVLASLARIAEKHKVAVLLVAHLNKRQGASAAYRIQGSIAFSAAARATWLVTKDPHDPDRRLLVPIKFNLAKDQAAYGFRVEGVDEGPIPALAWEPEPVLGLDANGLLTGGNRPGPTADRREEAKEFLLEILATGEVPAKEVHERAGRLGIARNTLQRAKDELEVQSVKRGRAWVWQLKGSEGTKDPNHDPPREPGDHGADDCGGVEQPQETQDPQVPRQGDDPEEDRLDTQNDLRGDEA